MTSRGICWLQDAWMEGDAVAVLLLCSSPAAWSWTTGHVVHCSSTKTGIQVWRASSRIILYSKLSSQFICILLALFLLKYLIFKDKGANSVVYLAPIFVSVTNWQMSVKLMNMNHCQTPMCFQHLYFSLWKHWKFGSVLHWRLLGSLYYCDPSCRVEYWNQIYIGTCGNVVFALSEFSWSVYFKCKLFSQLFPSSQ